MRLINSWTLELEDFSLKEIPPYAILSHTWGDDEVSFQDVFLPNLFGKKGYSKIERTCQLARERGLQFAWVDTCCIDKTSSAELTESINSMFRWYQEAAVCFVFLEDLASNDEINKSLSNCRWLTRGWTLQELLAPKNLEFYDKEGCFRGTKFSIIHTIIEITRIPIGILNGSKQLASYCVARKMSWAASRVTTRTEDTAYCLLGIFDVNMPLIYGEGIKAFRRLQEEIVKQQNDLTILSWENLNPSPPEPVLNLFATSPSAFKDSFQDDQLTDSFVQFSVTNLGLLISGDLELRSVSVRPFLGEAEVQRYIFYVSDISGIYMRKIGPKLYCRDGEVPLARFWNPEHHFPQSLLFEVSSFHILINRAEKLGEGYSVCRLGALRIPEDGEFTLAAGGPSIMPGSLWDVSDRVFLKVGPNRYRRQPYSMVLGMIFDTYVMGECAHIVVFCDFRTKAPKFKVTTTGGDNSDRLVRWIVKSFHENEAILWTDVEEQGLIDFPTTNNVDFTVKNCRFRVAVTSEQGLTMGIPDHYHSLKLSLTNLTSHTGKAGS